ncbi:MAG: hypothetical protein IKE69_11710 [Thermoguttaceae bacterium]|nr:hypothetical protein [Thermoguttaceae bacterium]
MNHYVFYNQKWWQMVFCWYYGDGVSLRLFPAEKPIESKKAYYYSDDFSNSIEVGEFYSSDEMQDRIFSDFKLYLSENKNWRPDEKIDVNLYAGEDAVEDCINGTYPEEFLDALIPEAKEWLKREWSDWFGSEALYAVQNFDPADYVEA